MLPAKNENSRQTIHTIKYVLLEFQIHDIDAAATIIQMELWNPNANIINATITTGVLANVIARINTDAHMPFHMPFTPYAQNVNIEHMMRKAIK